MNKDSWFFRIGQYLLYLIIFTGICVALAFCKWYIGVTLALSAIMGISTWFFIKEPDPDNTGKK